jgi:ribosomal protein S2
MKIKKIEHKNYKLLRFNLIKSKILKKNHILKNINIEDIEFRLKKILNVIFLYHISNKKILFIGNPVKINTKIKNILGKTKHVFIPKSTWVTGIITNQNSYLKSLFKQKTNEFNLISERILQLKKKSDLIVIMDQKLDKNAVEESYKAQIPIIALNSDLNIFDTKINYKLPGNFILSKNRLKNNFFYSILFSTIKKASIIKTKFKDTLSYKLTSIKKIKNTRIYKKEFNKKNNNKKQYYAFSKKESI